MDNDELFDIGNYFYDNLLRNFIKLETTKRPLISMQGVYKKKMSAYKFLYDIAYVTKNRLYSITHDNTSIAINLYKELSIGYERYIELVEWKIRILEKLMLKSEVETLLKGYEISHGAMEDHLKKMLPIWQTYCRSKM